MSNVPPMGDVTVGLKLAPQFTTVEQLRVIWRIADEAGFAHVWTYDHLASVGETVDGDVLEGWMLLAAMAEQTQRVRLGCMVTSNTFRHPAVLAKMATTVDHLSGGRLEFGIGAGWQEFEHNSLGIELPAPRERLDRLDEAVQVIKALWTEERVTFDGAHYRIADAVHNPKPVQDPHPPLWIGGAGRKRTLRLAAQHADAWNCVPSGPEEFGELCQVLDQHCADVGRDSRTIKHTAQFIVEPTEIASLNDRIAQYVEAGADELILVLRPGQPEADAKAIAKLLF